MKQIAFCLLMSLTLLFSTSCRKDLMNLHNSNDGTLSVSVAVNRSLYQGEYIQDGSGRFVGPTSESVSLSYNVDGQEFTTSLELELTLDGENLTGTATLTGLPVGVEGVVNVSTFNGDGEILCDAEENMILASGDNRTTITLSISDLCPFLEITDPAEYAFGTIAPGGVFFLMIENMTGGNVYEMQVYQEVETLDSPEIAVITGDGDRISFQELDSDTGGISFTLPSGAESAVICFYNPYSYEIPGLLWVDISSAYNSINYAGREDYFFDFTNTMGDSQDFRMQAVGGNLYLTSQKHTSDIYDGLWVSSDFGKTWINSVPISDNFMNAGDIVNSASITDLTFRNGNIYTALYHNISDSGEIGISTFNPLQNIVTSIYDSWYSSAGIYLYPYEYDHIKIAKSDTHTFLALHESNCNPPIN